LTVTVQEDIGLEAVMEDNLEPLADRVLPVDKAIMEDNLEPLADCNMAVMEGNLEPLADRVHLMDNLDFLKDMPYQAKLIVHSFD
jgi:hypothetical protein